MAEAPCLNAPATADPDEISSRLILPSGPTCVRAVGANTAEAAILANGTFMDKPSFQFVKAYFTAAVPLWVSGEGSFD